ncbi:MAG: hypothetical protein ACREVH_13570 [Gammaproteobacteria bacterium]
MSQISLGRKNSDDDLEPITPTNPVESRTVTANAKSQHSDSGMLFRQSKLRCTATPSNVNLTHCRM